MNAPLRAASTVACNRRGVLMAAAGGLVAPQLAGAQVCQDSNELRALARELGLVGMAARGLMQHVAAAVGPERMEAHRTALLARMAVAPCAGADMADMLRMWARDDFAAGNTTQVQGVRFADTEVALFALVRRG